MNFHKKFLAFPPLNNNYLLKRQFHIISLITNDTIVVFRTPYFNTYVALLGNFETFTIKISIVQILQFQIISFITNATLVVLRTPHLNTHGKILDGFDTFTIKYSKGSDLPISLTVNFRV